MPYIRTREACMYTLVDFITHIKGIEYIVSILAIGGFLLLWEILKPAPFRTIVSAGKQDMEYLQRSGFADLLKTMGKLVSAPFIGLAYLAMLPVGFSAAIIVGGTNATVRILSSIAGKNWSLDWRPMEAYFSGKNGKKPVKK
jgi:hypothetical protein